MKEKNHKTLLGSSDWWTWYLVIQNYEGNSWGVSSPPVSSKRKNERTKGRNFRREASCLSHNGYNEGFRKDRNLTDVLNMTSSATLHKVSHEMEKTNDQMHMRALGGRWNSSWTKDFPPEGKDQKWGLEWEARILVSSLCWQGTHEVQSVENTRTHSNSKPEGNHMNGKKKKKMVEKLSTRSQNSPQRNTNQSVQDNLYSDRGSLSPEEISHMGKALSRGHISQGQGSLKRTHFTL